LRCCPAPVSSMAGASHELHSGTSSCQDCHTPTYRLSPVLARICTHEHGHVRTRTHLLTTHTHTRTHTNTHTYNTRAKSGARSPFPRRVSISRTFPTRPRCCCSTSGPTTSSPARPTACVACERPVACVCRQVAQARRAMAAHAMAVMRHWPTAWQCAALIL
jgi:hypothetical protein